MTARRASRRSPPPSVQRFGAARGSAQNDGIHRIRHVVIVMQEHRSFDEYAGTFPGADRLPRDRAGGFPQWPPRQSERRP